MIRAMIDIETLDTNPRAIVMQVGVAKIKSGSAAVNSWSIYPNLSEQTNHLSRTFSASTVVWWAKVNADLFSVLMDKTSCSHDTSLQIRDFLAMHLFDADEVWANDLAFDPVILNDYLNQTWNGAGWYQICNHRNLRDGRTLKNLIRDTDAFREWVDRNPNTRAHDAESDAVWQLKMVEEFAGRISL